MKENVFRAVFAAAFGALCSYFMELLIPITVMLVVMIADYITGMVKAWYKSELSSRIGLNGIIKKVGYLVIVGVGMVLDYLLREALHSVGVSVTVEYTVALIVIVWFIINELISILENVSAIGAPMPEFILKLVKRLKVSVEEKAEVVDGEKLEAVDADTGGEVK